MAKKTHGPGIDDPLIVRKSGNDYFYYKNHQGSVTELRDSSGAGYKTYVYDAFGSMEETGPTFNRGFTYTGRELHNRSGLYYYRARFYNPELGRFLTPDLIGQREGANLYAYVANSPIALIDPLGLEPLPECTKRELQPYFQDVDLDKIDIHPNGIPWYVPGNQAAYTGKDYNIYFAPGEYNPYTPRGVGLIGHELVHVEQRQNNPPILFEIMYLMEYPADWINPFDDYNRFEDTGYLQDYLIRNNLLYFYPPSGRIPCQGN